MKHTESSKIARQLCVFNVSGRLWTAHEQQINDQFQYFQQKNCVDYGKFEFLVVANEQKTELLSFGGLSLGWGEILALNRRGAKLWMVTNEHFSSQEVTNRLTGKSEKKSFPNAISFAAACLHSGRVYLALKYFRHYMNK